MARACNPRSVDAKIPGGPPERGDGVNPFRSSPLAREVLLDNLMQAVSQGSRVGPGCESIKGWEAIDRVPSTAGGCRADGRWTIVPGDGQVHDRQKLFSTAYSMVMPQGYNAVVFGMLGMPSPRAMASSESALLARCLRQVSLKNSGADLVA